MITLSDEFELIKEWQALERRSRDIEFDRLAFCKKLRQRFGAGPSGDRHFKDWCVAKLKQTEPQADLMLTRSIAGGVFSDSSEFRAVGGESALDVFDMYSKAAEREAAMRTAVKESRNLRRVWQVMKRPAVAPLAYGSRSEAETTVPTARDNGIVMASRLAAFIAESRSLLSVMPGDVEQIVRVFVPDLPKRRTAKTGRGREVTVP